jgi:hypothetical protein
MSSRDMIHSPQPSISSKYLPIVAKLDTVLSNTFQSIRQLHLVIKSHCAGDEITAETLVSLMRASWAVENSQDSGHEIIANRDKKAYKTFIHVMNSITNQVHTITKKCNQHAIIPFHLTAEAMLFGGDIMVLTKQYRQ